MGRNIISYYPKLKRLCSQIIHKSIFLLSILPNCKEKVIFILKTTKSSLNFDYVVVVGMEDPPPLEPEQGY